jgi:dienelactone hydrolase
MSTFLMEVFNEIEYGTKPPIVDIDYHVTDSDSDIETAVERMSMSNDTDMGVAVETIMYDDNGFPLEGYLVMPMAISMMEGEGDDQLYPAVVIVPDWDGVNGPTGYEAERAVMMAKEGPYIAMVADIYGTEYTTVEDFDMKIELATKYRNDPTLFVGRIQAAIDMLIDHPNVDTTQIFVAGYW